MLGLHSTNFPYQNTITLSEDVLVQKFTFLSPQHQLSFVQGIQRPEYILSALNFPLKVDSFQTPIQLILSMYNRGQDCPYLHPKNNKSLYQPEQMANLVGPSWIETTPTCMYVHQSQAQEEGGVLSIEWHETSPKIKQIAMMQTGNITSHQNQSNNSPKQNKTVIKYSPTTQPIN